MMMLSYVSKRKRAVIMLSTIHSDASTDETTGDKHKPSFVTFYNGVDTADKNARLHLAPDARTADRCLCSILSSTKFA